MSSMKGALPRLNIGTAEIITPVILSRIEESDEENREQFENNLLRIFLLIAGTVEIAFAIIGNGLIIVCYCSYSKKHSAHSFYLLNLAFSDLLCCMLVMVPFYLNIVDNTAWLFPKEGCPVLSVLLYALGVQACLLTVIICYERLEVLATCLAKRLDAKSARAYVLMAISWLLLVGMVVALQVFLHESYLNRPAIKKAKHGIDVCDFLLDSRTPVTKGIMVSLTAAPMVSMLCMYVIFRQRFREPRKSIRCSIVNNTNSENQTAAMAVHISSHHLKLFQPRPDRPEVEFSSLIRMAERLRFFNVHLKARAKMMLLQCTFSLALWWLPFTVALCVVAWEPHLLNPRLIELFKWLFLLRSSINPMVYGRNNSPFRRTYTNILHKTNAMCYQCCCCCCSSGRAYPPTERVAKRIFDTFSSGEMPLFVRDNGLIRLDHTPTITLSQSSLIRGLSCHTLRNDIRPSQVVITRSVTVDSHSHTDRRSATNPSSTSIISKKITSRDTFRL